MHSPCKTSKVWAQRALYAAVRVFGPAVIPGDRAPWTDVIDESLWRELSNEWEPLIGDIDAAALYTRPQSERHGWSALLFRRGIAIAFARVDPDWTRIRSEFEVLNLVHAAKPRTFQVVRPIGAGQAGSRSWMLSTSVPNYPLGAVRKRATRSRVATEISEILSVRLPRPDGVPAHWTPAHGDFSPWNTRTQLSGVVRVIDWEDAGYAPPGLDDLYGDVTAFATFGGERPRPTIPETRAWLRQRLERRVSEQPSASRDQTRLMEILDDVPVS